MVNILKLSPEKLQLAMANRCMTITELSNLSSVSRVALTRCITQKSNAKPITIGKIAKALEVPVEELIETTAATVNQKN